MKKATKKNNTKRFKKGVVRHNAEVNDFKLGILTHQEIKLLLGLMATAQRQGVDNIVISRKDIVEKLGLNSRESKPVEFRKTIVNMFKKMGLIYKELDGYNRDLEPDDADTVIFIFSALEYRRASGDVIAEFTPHFARYFLEFSHKFVQYDTNYINHYCKGKHSANLLRLLMGERNYKEGKQEYSWYSRPLDEFKVLMGIQNYRKVDVIKKVVEPAIKDLTKEDEFGNQAFNFITCEVTKNGCIRFDFLASGKPYSKELKANVTIDENGNIEPKKGLLDDMYNTSFGLINGKTARKIYAKGHKGAITQEAFENEIGMSLDMSGYEENENVFSDENQDDLDITEQEMHLAWN